MKLIYLSVVVASVFALSGCSSFKNMKTVRDAINHGYVSDLSATNRFDTIIWSVPSVPMGPYSKISTLTAYKSVGPTNSQIYVFLLGKSSKTKDWEVFGCTTRTNRHWEYVPVTLPQAPSK